MPSRLKGHDARNRPATNNRIESGIHVSTKLLAPSEGQIPDEICGETMKGNGTAGAAQVKAVEPVVSSRSNLLVKLSAIGSAKIIFDIVDGLGPLVAGSV